VSSSVVETAELSGGAMMIDISLAQNDVDNFKWGGNRSLRCSQLV